MQYQQVVECNFISLEGIVENLMKIWVYIFPPLSSIRWFFSISMGLSHNDLCERKAQWHCLQKCFSASKSVTGFASRQKKTHCSLSAHSVQASEGLTSKRATHFLVPTWRNLLNYSEENVNYGLASLIVHETVTFLETRVWHCDMKNECNSLLIKDQQMSTIFTLEFVGLSWR